MNLLNCSVVCFSMLKSFDFNSEFLDVSLLLLFVSMVFDDLSVTFAIHVSDLLQIIWYYTSVLFVFFVGCPTIWKCFFIFHEYFCCYCYLLQSVQYEILITLFTSTSRCRLLPVSYTKIGYQQIYYTYYINQTNLIWQRIIASAHPSHLSLDISN